MNHIHFGNNLPILREIPDESVDLIYIDPPFNTGKKQELTKIKTVKDENGNRIGYQGNSYQTIIVGKKAYQDSFNFDTNGIVSQEIQNAYDILAPNSSIYFIEGFLRPRLVEAKRILKKNGGLYFHIDYREVHYCKILLDNIFGRDCFINEIIWAYDFGGRAKSRWPAKHDNILFYVKDPNNYIFNANESDREEYMAPGLVGPEKAKQKKLPTDTWFWPYVGMRNTDTWWQSIVGTNSKERLDYPTQKPRKVIDRIIKVSSYPGNIVLDFFAGSGTVGESCLENNREFILIDNNLASMEVMAKRFSGIANITWHGYQPLVPMEKLQIQDFRENDKADEEIPEFSPEFKLLASTASFLQKDLEEVSNLWKNSPFEWILQLPARKKGMLGRKLIAAWCSGLGLYPQKGGDSSETLVFNKIKFSIKFSTLWTTGVYKFQQIKSKGFDYLICLGISPFDAHCWILSKEQAIKFGKPQHKGANGAEYWLEICPKKIPEWAKQSGGSLTEAFKLLKNITK